MEVFLIFCFMEILISNEMLTLSLYIEIGSMKYFEKIIERTSSE